MGIIDNFLIKSVKNNDIKGVKLTLILYDALNSFRKFFSKTMSLKNTGSFDINNNQALNQALGHATDHKIIRITSYNVCYTKLLRNSEFPLY